MGNTPVNQDATAALTGMAAFKMNLYFWLQALTVAMVTLILLFTFVGRIVGVVGSSMLPNLHHGDAMLLQSMGYKPAQGDVVVLTKHFGHIKDPIVKRVVAVGGQTVDIDYESQTLSVDGVILSEPYILEPMGEPGFEDITHITVPEGSVFVMGDNRNNSDDSRDVALGTVDERYILGRVRMVLLPFSRFQIVE